MTASLKPLDKAKNVVSESLDLLRASRERLDQMTAVFNSIKSDLLHCKSHNIKTLSELGGFLGYDWSNYVDCQIEEMQKTADELEVCQ